MLTPTPPGAASNDEPVTVIGSVIAIPTDLTTFSKVESPLKNVSEFAVPPPSLDGDTVPEVILAASITPEARTV